MDPKKVLGLAVALGALLAMKIGFIGMALWFECAYPAARQKILNLYQTRRRKCFITGAVNILFCAALILFLFATKVLAFLAVLLLATLVVIGVAGYGIGYRDVGGRIDAVAPQSPFRNTLLGGLIVEAAFLAPVAGQLLSISILFRGAGAVILSMLARNANASEPVARDS